MWQFTPSLKSLHLDISSIMLTNWIFRGLKILVHVTLRCCRSTSRIKRCLAKNPQTEMFSAETQRLTCVSGSGYTPFIHVSVAAVSMEPDHFFCTFP